MDFLNLVLVHGTCVGIKAYKVIPKSTGDKFTKKHTTLSLSLTLKRKEARIKQSKEKLEEKATALLMKSTMSFWDNYNMY